MVDLKMSASDEPALFETTLARLRAGYVMRQSDADENARRLRDGFERQAARLELQADAAEACIDEAMAAGGGPRISASPSTARAKAAALRERAEKISALITEFTHAALGRVGSDTPGPTPEAKARGPSQATSVLRLFIAGTISAEHMAAADEICRIYEAIARPVGIKARSLDGAMSSNKSASFGIDYSGTNDWIVRAHRKWFRPWCEQLRALGTLEFAFAVVVDGMSLEAARRRWRMNYKAAFRRLIFALELWSAISGLEKRLLARVGVAAQQRRPGRRRTSSTAHTTNF